ncbi:non-canonical purine NTP pyrophosphatase, partial [Rosenbergiella nectarea]|uniref:non-canonical purine NTP pyrophosphatase n=2 Tax=Rosenbergiella TaxID=1356488 RepID=UPI00240DAEF3
TPIVCYGRWPGMIAREPSGQGGFGYDPIFYLPEQQKSAAEMSKAEKSALSHRGQALQQLMEALRNG